MFLNIQTQKSIHQKLLLFHIAYVIQYYKVIPIEIANDLSQHSY